LLSASAAAAAVAVAGNQQHTPDSSSRRSFIGSAFITRTCTGSKQATRPAIGLTGRTLLIALKVICRAAAEGYA